MIIKTYTKYIIKQYFEIIFKVTMIFYCLIFLLNILEELSFFKNTEIGFLFPIFLTFLNSPSILYDILPFILLISTQFFFIQTFEKNELIIYKNFGLSNLKILKILTYFSFIFGLFIIFIFYNVSAKFKYFYLDLKNVYTLDNKYLAVITENGLWIKDEINESTLLINADSVDGHFLKNVSITEFSTDFQLKRSIQAKKVDIKNTKWKIYSAKISINNFTSKKDELFLDTHFNLEKINNLFSNLSSLTMWQINKLKQDYEELGYSIVEIDTHKHKIIAYPIYLMIMTILSGIIMLNIKINKSRVFNLILGISLSVVIYYIRYFFNLLGENERIPIIMSIWFPLVILLILCSIGLVRINEK